MKNQKIFNASFVRRLPLLFIAVLLAGLALVITLVPLARADTNIYVRPGGDDTHCNGTADVDYSPAVAPACALQTLQTAFSVAGSSETVVYTDGSLSRTFAGADKEIGAAATSMSISKSDSPDPVDVGAPLIYTIRVTNTGAAVANQVAVVESLPPGVVSYVDGTATTSQGTCSFDSLSFNITCDLGTLNATQSAIVTVPVTPTAAGVIENVAIVKSPDLGGLQPTVVETTFFSGTTNVSISKSDSSDPAPVGSQLAYTIIVTNSGPHAAAAVTVTDSIPANTTFVSASPSQGTSPCPESSGVVTCNLGLLGVSETATITVIVIPNAEGIITNTVVVTPSGFDNDPGDNEDTETTRIIPGAIYLPIIIKSDTIVPPPGSTPTPTPTPIPLAYVSDVAADIETDQAFIASPRHNWVYAIDGATNTFPRVVPVGNGPTGLTVLSATALIDNKVFVAHFYGANFYQPGVKAFGVQDPTSHDTSFGGYAGSQPVKIASNGTNNSRVYVSNYNDNLAVIDGASGPPENRLGWVVQKAYQGAYGIDASSATNRVYLATRDTGELVVFDGNSDRLLQSDYIPTHVKPPVACSLWSVAVNPNTGHVFVPCPQTSQVFVLEEGQVTVLSLEALGVLEDRNGQLALVVSPAAAPWIATIDVPGGTNLGEEGIAVDTDTGYVFITNASNDTLVVLQDSGTPSYVTTVSVGDQPQGVDVNRLTQRVYVGNTGDNTVTVLDATSPFSTVTVIPLTP